jgi:hypothetical protein
VKTIALKLDQRLVDRLDGLAATRPKLTRAAVARLALLLGIAELEADPVLLSTARPRRLKPLP